MRSRSSRLKLSPFLLDVTLSAAASAATMLSVVVVTELLAHALVPDAFGAWGLSRRVSAWIGYFSVTPVGIALARYAAAATDDEQRDGFLVAAVMYGVLPTLILVAIGLLLRNWLTVAVFHDPLYTGLWLATLATVLASGSYTVLYAWYRGTQRIRAASGWQVWTIGLGPVLVAFAAKGNGVGTIVGVTALAVALPILPLAADVRRSLSGGWARLHVGERLRELMRYAVPRIPGGIAVGALAAVGPFMAPYFGSLKDAGYLVAGQSILRVVEAGTGAFGMVVLPKLAGMQAANEKEFIRSRVEDIAAMAIHLGLYMTAHMWLWSREIVLTWLGAPYESALPIIRMPLLAAPLYLGFALLRSAIDAIDTRAINTVNLVVAVVVTALLSAGAGYAGYGVLGLAVAGTVGFGVLGGLTLAYVWRSLSLRGGNLHLLSALVLNVIVAGVMVLVRMGLAHYWSGGRLLIIGGVVEAPAFLTFLVVLRMLKVRWVLEIESRVVARRADG